ncbi:MAG: ATP-binding protein [Bryobacteraceae bacterium]
MAGEFGLKYCYVSAASLCPTGLSASPEENIRSVFVEASADQPVLLFIDEIDALGTKRQQVSGGRYWWSCALVQFDEAARLMECIDDARRKSGVILMGATNYDRLDRALIRDGRFDLHIRLDLPNEEERAPDTKPNCRNALRSESTFSHSRAGHLAGVLQKSVA